MSEELLINVSPMESRVALLNDGVLREIYIERHNKLGLVGNIYVGTIVRVLPGMQAAFVDIGQSRTAFLHVNDMKKIKKPKNDNYLVNPVNQHTIDSVSLLDNINLLRNNVNSLKNGEKEQQNSNSYQKVNQEGNNPIQIVNDTLTTQPESFFSSKQFPKDTSTKDLSIKNLVNQIHQVNQTSQDVISCDKESLTSNVVSDTVIQENTSTHNNVPDNKPKIPKFSILPTVTEILTKKSLTPSVEEQESDISVNDGSLDDTSEGLKPPKTKNQPQTNSSDLIQNRVREGQHILVQVTKDQLGTKGARLTTNISLPSRYLVYLPSSDNIGISQRIDNETERKRLKADLASLMQQIDLQGGLIARTAAEKVSKKKLQEDIEYLLQLWQTVQNRHRQVSSHKSSVLVYQELSLPLRSLRDLVHEKTDRVVVDDAEMYDNLRQFAHDFVPMILPRIVPYHSQQPMFDVYRVEEDLRDALKRRVNLKSGGYLIIDQTEAMTTIDVNTGSFVGGRSLEDTVYKTNLEATHAIARQLRLRNLGGIIILDFIDMQEEEHRDDVLISLQTQLAEDYARTNITQISELGLVEMTRKRTRESLEQQLCEPCKVCEGKGFIKTSETVCFEIFREIMRCARTYDAPKQFTVVAHASVIDLLLTSEANTVADLEYLIGRVITFDVENLYTQEQYDIVLD